MSRRYGRNQRRRAREALAAAGERIGQLEKSLVSTIEAAARHVSEKHALIDELRRSEWFLQDVAELVGREAIIAGEPTTLNFKWDQRDGDHINFVPRVPFSVERYKKERAEDSYKIRDEVLRLLNVEVVQEVMRHQVHARVTLADERVGYTISESALRRMPREQIRKHIGEPLLKLLVEQLMKRRR